MCHTLGPYLSYYWTLWQSEWATDLIMDAPATLTATMASLLQHAWITGNSANVLRYLGRPLTGAGKPHANSNNEVISRLLDFHDGLRLLRDHGLIRKLPNRHRYHLTDKGRQLTTALQAMLSASTEQLLDIAA
jgi:hypothetical protein